MKTQDARRALCCAAIAAGMALTMPAGAVVPKEELTDSAFTPAEPVQNAEFMPSANAGAARQAFSGTLTLEAEEMRFRPGLASSTVFGKDATMFPPVALQFFSEDGVLVPATQEIVTPRSDASDASNSFWNIIVQPGRVWSEPGEDGWSRASFPFALMNQMENDTHNGIATFLFNESGVSQVRMQIVQQTAPYYIPEHFMAWQQLGAEYAPDASVGSDRARAAWRKAEADRLPAETWDALEETVGAGTVEGFDGEMNPDFLVTAALVRDGTLYYKPSQTPMGPYPYTLEMRFGIWSATKSVGPALSMLRLAQKYGPYVFDLKVKDYADVPAGPAWDDIRFGDLLNMASGLGGGTVVSEPNDMYADYLDDSYDAWYISPSSTAKMAEITTVGHYPWGAGQVARYRDRDMFLLGVAINGFLRSVEGPGADVWEMLRTEVFEPAGIHAAPMNRTIENDGARGQPIMAWGWYPTLDDMAKVARLLHQGGVANGQPILHPGLTASIFSADDALPQGQKNSYRDGMRLYKMGFHYLPVRDRWTGQLRHFPYMSGWIGNKVLLLPGDTTAIRVSNAWPAPDEAQRAAEDPTPMADVVNRMRAF